MSVWESLNKKCKVVGFALTYRQIIDVCMDITNISDDFIETADSMVETSLIECIHSQDIEGFKYLLSNWLPVLCADMITDEIKEKVSIQMQEQFIECLKSHYCCN